jgi:BASS family bile acid:Na+ symporter
MAALNTIIDTRVWIVFGVLCALLLGPVGDISSTLLVIVLIIQMTLSMDGLSFNSKSLKENRLPILYSVAACYIVSTGMILLLGTFFIGDHPEIWKGWVMLASVPCAVSVVTMSFFSKGNTMMCVLSLAVIYFVALAVTPLVTLTLIGESVSVLKIFTYVVLFIVIPMAASVPLKKLNISRNARVISINAMLFLLVLLSLGQNRDFLFSEPGIIIFVAAACAVRIFVVSFAMMHILKKKNARRDNSMAYIPMAVWKNSGLAITLCFILFGSATEAVMPCVISLLVELLWFAIMSRHIEKAWPAVKDAEPAANG